MKYLKPLSAILLGRCATNTWERYTEDYTTTLVVTIGGRNGEDEQLCGIYVTKQQLKQIRYEIDRYLNYLDEFKPVEEALDSKTLFDKTESPNE